MEFAFDSVPHRAQLSASSEVAAQSTSQVAVRSLPALLQSPKNQFGVPTVGVTRQHHTYTTAMSMTRVVNEYRVNLRAERM